MGKIHEKNVLDAHALFWTSCVRIWRLHPMHWFARALFASSFKSGQLKTLHPPPPTAAFWKFYKVENKEE